MLSNPVNIDSTKPLILLRKIGKHLETQRKKELILLLILSLFASLAESISIAALIPFVNIFLNPETFLLNSYSKVFLETFGLDSQNEVFFGISVFFISIVLLCFFLKITYTKLSNRVTDNIASDFRVKIFNFFINQDLSYHSKYSSSEVMSNLSQKTDNFITIIFSSINIINSIFICTAVVIILVINEPIYSPIIVGSGILFFLIIFKIKSKNVLKKGKDAHLRLNVIVDIFSNTVGYLPEIIIYNLQKYFSVTLRKASQEAAKAFTEIRSISQLPRIYLETFIIILVVMLIYWSASTGGTHKIDLSYIAILGYAAQKCLPLLSSIYSLSINFKGSTPPVLNFLDILDRENETKKAIENINYENLNFSKSLALDNISFRYNENMPKIFNKLSLTIKKGDKIAIKGGTGSGKTTLANIVCGLLKPNEGKILVDGVSINLENVKKWQKNISIVPQTVFLTDSTILENIAIGVETVNIDIVKAKDCSRMAEINEFIEKLPNGYNQQVGEKGARLSGGQRQRIGLARALYRNAKLIILDEPTNALDVKIEQFIINTLTKLNKDITLIVISHNENSLKHFDEIIDIDEIK
ncbi:ABC transporter ATP-binding protein/permease [Pelagibacteraceae bacterium]|nr:ABC transporter ATP-binding protein/permease [Pelagibacteraceae bacterium]